MRSPCSLTGLTLLAVAWSLVMPAFGMLQMQLLPGKLHWLIQLAHLVVGMIAIGRAT